ncbi:Uncharacterised protein [Mycobacteroides abscessus subsp. abscessus]|nr:Uncharacterised protein [Mycobacteroides abscessus subsp. abscessus]
MRCEQNACASSISESDVHIVTVTPMTRWILDFAAAAVWSSGTRRLVSESGCRGVAPCRGE